MPSEADVQVMSEANELDDEIDDDLRLVPASERVTPPPSSFADASYATDFKAFIEALGLRHFVSSEFLVLGGQNSSGSCAGLNHFPDRALWNNIVETAKVLDELRERLGGAIDPTSIFRSQAYNSCIPGAAGGSLHKRFNAVDFKCRDGNGPVHWAKTLKAMRDDGFFKGGIGVYNTFVHVDTRGSNANFGPLRDRVF